MTGGPLTAPSADAFAHQLLVYRSTDELVEATVPFVRDGVRDGDAVLMVASPDKLEAVRSRLSPDEEAAVSFESAWRRYARPGVALTEFQQFINEHCGEGRRVRVVGEAPMGWMRQAYQRQLCCNDAAFNVVAHAPGASVVCPVDARETHAEVLDGLRRSHPEVVEAGARRANPAFTEPSELLAREFNQPLPEPHGEAEELVPDEPASARSFVDDRLADLLDADRRNDFVTAVHEVVANAFTHAVMDRLRLWHEDEHVVCEVRDEGNGLPDPLVGYRPPTLEQTSGWGLWLARQLTEVVEMHTGPQGSVVRLHAELVSVDGGR